MRGGTKKANKLNINKKINTVPSPLKGIFCKMIIEKIYYLTKEGLEKIKREYENLKHLKLAKTNGESPKILHSEDLDPEYLAFQEDMNFLESKLAETETILKHAILIKSPSKEKQNMVDLGAKIEVEVDGQPDELQIVGTLEANPVLGKISNESPVGRALLGHKIGDEVLVQSSVKTLYKIKKIQYKMV